MKPIKPKGVKWLGWSPEFPSIKDWLMRDHPGKKDDPLPPASRDRRADGVNPPVRDQGANGACVGFSSTYAVGYLRRVDRDAYSTVYSAQEMYYDARTADGVEWKDVDSGAYIRDAMDSLRNIGIAPESAWPYKKPFNKTPTRYVYKVSERWKLGVHWRCESLDDVKLALSMGYGVVGGISCYSSMMTEEVDRTGVIPMPTHRDKLEGGHALYFDMYDDGRQQLRFENSWGAGWGDDGYGYLPYDYLKHFGRLADDFWAMQAEAPETTPWKD